MKTKENGITLVALVIMTVLILILASIGYTVGDSTINSAKFTQFRNELKVMQTKVNELNQENKTDVGQDITEAQKTVLEKQEISDIIYNGKSEEVARLQSGENLTETAIAGAGELIAAAERYKQTNRGK